RSIFDAAPEEIAAVAPPVAIEQHPRFAWNQGWMRALAAVMLVALLAGAGFTGYQMAERNRPADAMMTIGVDFMTPMPENTTAKLEYDPKTGLLMLSTTNMPAAPENHVYQVWLIGAHGPESVGMMGSSGFATMMEAKGYTQLAVTVEPGPNGSPGPTTDPIVVASLAGMPTS
ncbi:MAG: anti-sigma factor, partial [Thermomicrobiales bacterium]